MHIDVRVRLIYFIQRRHSASRGFFIFSVMTSFLLHVGSFIKTDGKADSQS